jgi:hypothetical protein
MMEDVHESSSVMYTSLAGVALLSLGSIAYYRKHMKTQNKDDFQRMV